MPDVSGYVAPSDVAPSNVGAPHRSRRRLWWFLLGGVLVCLAGICSWLLLRELLKPAPTPAVLPIPVVAAVAQAGDVPVYLTGLGTVEAYNTVTVHFLVNGTLDKVVFVEGQDVKAGELLAQIDPRPYQAQLNQVVAAVARDDALLANARLDLQRYQKLAAENSIATQIEPISVLFTLPEDDFGVVNREMAVGPLTVTASSRADDKVLGQGAVLLINNEIDQTTGTIQLKATFPNKNHALWPNFRSLLRPR
jgi:membrane fusion protein, multidrug efflux system